MEQNSINEKKSESAVGKNFSFIVIPFRFSPITNKKATYLNAFDSPKKENVQWIKKDLKFNYLNENVVAMILSKKDNEPICASYQFSNESKKNDSIPRIGGHSVFSINYKGVEIVKAKLQEVDATLFYSGIGFFAVKIEFFEKDPEKVKEGIYYLTQVKRNSTVLKYEDKVSKDETVQKEISLIDLMDRLLGDFIETESFDWGNDSYSNNVLMNFSYIMFDNMPADFKRYTSNIAHNQKGSYHIIPKDEDYYHPFENEYFVYSLSGVLCVTLNTSDENTNDFFKNNHPQRLEADYLYLFLLRQHQRFLLRILEKDYVRLLPTIKDSKKVDELYFDGLNMQVKCAFNHPSSIEHINKYDEYLKSHLYIQEDSDSFLKLLNRLLEYSELLKEKERSEIQKAESKRNLRFQKNNFWALIPTAIWTTVLATNQSIETAKKFTQIQWVCIVIGGIMGLASFVTQLIGLIKNWDEIKKTEKEI